MDNLPNTLFSLSDRSYVSIVKKEIKKIAEQIGFKGKKLAEIEIIISEIASNIIKHTSGGNILVKHYFQGKVEGLELISIDKGPGMSNALMMLKDGISTTNTLGQGLGAIKRLSDNFDIYSAKNWGTILLSRVFLNPEAEAVSDEAFTVHVLMIPGKGETFCGDGYTYIIKKNLCQILAFDGLGHGPEAQKASEAAIRNFMETLNEEPASRLKTMNTAIKNTRGGVGMVFNIDLNELTLSFCGVGNISARVLTEGKFRSCISYNGIIGHTFPNTLHSNKITWSKQDYLIVTSDGLNTRWDINLLPNLLKHDPAIVAASLIKDFSRGNDDALIMIVKCNKKLF